jgi:hypothetical protein
MESTDSSWLSEAQPMREAMSIARRHLFFMGFLYEKLMYVLSRVKKLDGVIFNIVLISTKVSCRSGSAPPVQVGYGSW